MPVEIVVPELGESVVEATVGRWLKHEGDRVAVGEAVVELETDKVNLEVGAEKDGVLAKITRQQGDDVKIGDVLGVIDEAAAAVPAAKAPTPEPKAMPERQPQPLPEPAPTPENGERITPVARRMAAEHNIDLSRVGASGPGNRVTKEDVQRYLNQPQPAPAQAPRKEAPAPTVETHRNGREERVKMSRRRRTIAQRLVEAQHTAAMLTTFNEVDMSAVMDLREQRKAAFKDKFGVSLGITSFFVKAVIGALKQFPRLNAELDGDELVLKKYYDIGIAVGAEEGLVVPVLREADRMSFAAIEKAIKRFGQQASEGTLSLEDLRGGTFTITNGGVFGSMLSTPILNPPQVGILGLHKIEQRPIALNGQVVIRPMMYVALSYDHRIVDGRESVQFLVRVKELLEDPNTLLLEG
ncbi:MAG: 2-oxoglutarate dehydrogenase complex dihydrolipoyllysine-residue succinyltransferase [Anaerolineae bacterium]|nr:2-oxoglutarate dehydrogenase complex dihydrolipoyllysine-residue succinyltransferase [Anaerolineae bacterium]